MHAPFRYFGSSTVLDSPGSGATSPAESLSPPLSRSTSPGGGTLQRLQSWEEEGGKRCVSVLAFLCWRFVCCYCVKLGSIPVDRLWACLLLCLAGWLSHARKDSIHLHTVVSLNLPALCCPAVVLCCGAAVPGPALCGALLCRAVLPSALPCPALPCAALPCAVRMVCCCVCGVQGRLGWHVDGWWRTAPAAVIIRRRRKGQKALVEAKRVRGGVADRCALGFGLASPCLAYLAAGCCLPGSCVCHCATVFHACLRACPSASLRACVCLCVCSCVAFVSREWLVKPSVSPCA